MPDFLDVVVPTSTSDVVDAAIQRFQTNLSAAGITGYIPNEGNLEIILINSIAAMAVGDILVPGAQVPQAIFRTYGTQLFNLAYNNGATATATSTWTLTDTLGHTIPQGTQVTVGAYGFSVETDVVVSSGLNTGTVNLVAVQSGSAYNGQSGSAQLVDALTWVSSVSVSTSSGGADQELDPDYANRLAAALALQAPRPITATDYAAFTLTAPETTIGAAVGRATAIDGFNPGVTTFSGTTHGTTSVTAVSSITGVTVGSIIAAADITAGQTVATVGSTSFTLSAVASGSNSGETMTATGSYGNERTVTVFVTDPNGNALSSGAMTNIQTWLEGYREVNFAIYVQAPTYTNVYVTFEVHVLPGYVAASVVANCETAILNYLNPLTWGNPATSGGPGGTTWLNSASGFNVVRYNKLLGIIENVPGVDYVPPGSSGLALGVTASPSGTTDLTLAGPAPLPLSNTSTPTVVGSAV